MSLAHLAIQVVTDRSTRHTQFTTIADLLGLRAARLVLPSKTSIASNLPRSYLDAGGSATFFPSGCRMGEPGKFG